MTISTEFAQIAHPPLGEQSSAGYSLDLLSAANMGELMASFSCAAASLPIEDEGTLERFSRLFSWFMSEAKSLRFSADEMRALRAGVSWAKGPVTEVTIRLGPDVGICLGARNALYLSPPVRPQKADRDPRMAVARDWISENMTKRPGASARRQTVFDAYTEAMNDAGYFPVSANRFGRLMTQLGVNRKIVSGRVFYTEMALKRRTKTPALKVVGMGEIS